MNDETRGADVRGEVPVLHQVDGDLIVVVWPGPKSQDEAADSVRMFYSGVLVGQIAKHRENWVSRSVIAFKRWFRKLKRQVGISPA